MKPLLMHPHVGFDPGPLPAGAQDLAQDLSLEPVLGAMAAGDAFIRDVARQVVLAGAAVADLETVRYRQAVAADCLSNAVAARALYRLATDAVEERRRHYLFGLSRRYPSSVLHSAMEMLGALAPRLRDLRVLVQEHAGRVRSGGLRRLFAMVRRELDDAYLAEIHDCLAELRFRGGVLLSARLDPYNEGADYTLRRPRDTRPQWLRRVLGHPAYTFRIEDRDEAGARLLGELRDRGVRQVAGVLSAAADHVLGFFEALRTELAFYIGCLNLYERLIALGAPVCFPQPEPIGARSSRYRGLYDVSLALTAGCSPVGNDLDADGKAVVLITGANTGGKSTFLRSVGLAQVMMQCGMFVGARAFHGGLCSGVFTHYLREEETVRAGGKLDEELARMSAIADALAPDALLLFNESFSSTNEREGAEIARQVVRALVERRIKVFFVTHLYALAYGLYREGRGDTLFLRAERRPDGTRTYKLLPGAPQETSYGRDLYREVFRDDDPGPRRDGGP